MFSDAGKYFLGELFFLKIGRSVTCKIADTPFWNTSSTSDNKKIRSALTPLSRKKEKRGRETHHLSLSVANSPHGTFFYSGNPGECASIFFLLLLLRENGLTLLLLLLLPGIVSSESAPLWAFFFFFSFSSFLDVWVVEWCALCARQTDKKRERRRLCQNALGGEGRSDKFRVSEQYFWKKCLA